MLPNVRIIGPEWLRKELKKLTEALPVLSLIIVLKAVKNKLKPTLINEKPLAGVSAIICYR